MAEEKKPEMLDPIAYRPDYNPNDIIGSQNANVNYGQYGDDSSPDKQQESLGGLAEKNSGEGVSNSNVDYNPDIKTGDLDPNYKYGENARQQNKQEAGYIAKRNDNIASALYNEGLVTKEDIAYYLASQPDWNNSTEMDRANTIESIWKRIGEMGDKEQPEAGEKEIVNDTSGEIFGKATADKGDNTVGIKTKADANSAFRQMEEARQAQLNELLRTPPASIAAALDSGSLPTDMQAVIDLQAFYPERRAEVQEYLNQYEGQEVINAITNGEEIPAKTNTVSNANNNIADVAAENATSSESMADIIKDIHQTIEADKTAQGANETMADIEEEIAILNNRLKNLKKEAQNTFKGDVPDYIVNAYINNRTQEIQNNLSILSERYKYASARYDKAIANAQWEKEYAIKERQVKIQEDAQALNEWQIKNGKATSTVEPTQDTSATNSGDKYQVTTLTDKEVSSAVDDLLDMFDNGQLGKAQCGVGIQRYYLPMLGISINGISDYEDKIALINEGDDYIPKKGDLIILSSKSKPGNGHIGIVIGVSEDGTITYLDWNGTIGKDGQGTEKAAISGININDGKIQGFRNINKGQSGTGTRELADTNGWTDYDYTRFEQYRDATSESVKKTIAEEYSTDVAGMSNIVREALANRPENTTGNGGEDYLDEFGYDPDKGYNVYDTQLYQRFFAGGTNNSAEALAEASGVSTDEFISRARRWKAGNKGQVESMLAEGLNSSQRQLLSQIVSGDIKLSNSNEKVYADLLGLGGDVELLNQVIGEAYEIEGKKQLSEALRVAAELQILFEDYERIKDDGDFNTSFYMGAGMLSTIGRKFDQLKNALKLDKVVSARGRGTTFGSMTEGEWEMLGKAVTSLSIALDSDKQFTKGFKGIVTDLWAAQYGTPGGEIVGPTSEEWNNYVQSVKKSRDFNISNGGVKNNPPSGGKNNAPTTSGPNAPTSGGGTGNRESFKDM